MTNRSARSILGGDSCKGTSLRSLQRSEKKKEEKYAKVERDDDLAHDGRDDINRWR